MIAEGRDEVVFDFWLSPTEHCSVELGASLDGYKLYWLASGGALYGAGDARSTIEQCRMAAALIRMRPGSTDAWCQQSHIPVRVGRFVVYDRATDEQVDVA